MDAQILSVLVQVPFLAAFIWYSLQMLREMRTRDQQWGAYLEKQTAAIEAMREAMEAMARQIDRNTAAIILAAVGNEQGVPIADALGALRGGGHDDALEKSHRRGR